LPQLRTWFLIYRVELKVKFELMRKPSKEEFLIYRVELKDIIVLNLVSTNTRCS